MQGSFGEYRFSVDREATRLAYSEADKGWTQSCGCFDCKNFIAARERVFPKEFLALLEDLGIDFRKEADVTRMGSKGRGHYYSGFFHFVGTLETNSEYRVKLATGFYAWLRNGSGACIEPLKGKQLVQLEFQAEEVPWALDIPPEPRQ